MSSEGVKEDCLGWAARDPSGLLSPYKFSRRTVGSDDVSIRITHCGVCYADVAWTRNEHGDSKYPLVPGYCFRIPENYPLALAAPLLCAGITVYTPMMRHKMNQPGKSLGVIGLGGLGHMAVKFGKAFGLKVTVFSTSISKKEEALNLLGADHFVVSSDQEQMKAMAKSLNFIIDTASGDHPFDPYMSLLKTGGILALVGFPSEVKFSPGSLNIGMKTVSGSKTGGTKDIPKMMDFCAAQKIYPKIELIPIDYANEALERLIKRDVKYRFVIDIENSLKCRLIGKEGSFLGKRNHKERENGRQKALSRVVCTFLAQWAINSTSITCLSRESIVEIIGIVMSCYLPVIYLEIKFLEKLASLVPRIYI
ncbi:probable cinnamyl alcohol dehydrogenase 1 [Syzygium oleosum]|uniref:probable cinnamyl alcohol dehydrogenase 1 n=1 Tax=Syzygium oleosum TaxID=219896 RepID=UPI0024B8A50D|nr:probable cinnamyl alcohol dehydrogenase 1 [Syzygium oleosum]